MAHQRIGSPDDWLDADWSGFFPLSAVDEEGFGVATLSVLADALGVSKLAGVVSENTSTELRI